MRSVSIQINKDDGIHIQAHRGVRSLNGIGSEVINFLIVQIFFCYSWFRLQSITIHCNRRTVQTDYTSHESFLEHFHFVHITLWLKVSQRAHSLHPNAIHDVTCLSVRWLFLVLSSSFLSRASTWSLLSTCSLSCTSTSTILNPPRIAPCAHPFNEEYCTMAMQTLSQVMSPTSLTTSTTQRFLQ